MTNSSSRTKLQMVPKLHPAAENPPDSVRKKTLAPATSREQKSNTESGVRSPRVSTAGSTRAEPRPSARPIKPSMTPAEALRKYSEKLTAFEQSEILEFPNIWFVGPGSAKIAGVPHGANNSGFDDDRGDYKVVLGDHLEYRYEVLSVLGRGSFGQVVKVVDHKKDLVLALKVIRNKKRFHHQALVEVKILEHLMKKDREGKSNIVRVHGYFYFRNHLCITFESLGANLYEHIKANNFKGLALPLIRKFAIQILVSLNFLKKERIIHCDLKPENILLKNPSTFSVRLIDFGSSCFEHERIYTYIQSRFYRSPEVILGFPYDLAIDMWSFGCILSELLTGYPLFPGENETEQIQCIMEVLGPPPKKMIVNSSRRKAFFDADGNPLTVPNSRGKVRTPSSKTLAAATKCNDQLFLSFLKRCLKWDPKVRWTPDKALEHPWVCDNPPRPPRESTPSDRSDEEEEDKKREPEDPGSGRRKTGGGKQENVDVMFPPISEAKSSIVPKPPSSHKTSMARQTSMADRQKPAANGSTYSVHTAAYNATYNNNTAAYNSTTTAYNSTTRKLDKIQSARGAGGTAMQLPISVTNQSLTSARSLYASNGMTGLQGR